MCTKYLLKEHESVSFPHCSEKVKLLVDMLQPQFQSVFNYDDLWNGLIYEHGEEKKNIVTSLAHQEMQGLTRFRIKLT